MTDPMSVTSGALFAGYGGLSRAVEAVLGANLRWVSDIPAYDKEGQMVGNAPAILAHRYPDVPNLGDITTIDWDDVEPVDIMDGGSPCQDVSSAGKRAGMTAGTRSNLWVAMRDAINQVEPAIVVWENVRGVTSARADSDVEPCPGCVGDDAAEPALRALGRVVGDLADLGYLCAWRGLRAADIGAPHGRFRIFLVAAHPGRFARLERRLAAAGETPRWRALGTAPRRDRAPIAALLPTPRSADRYATMGAPAALRHVEAGNGSLPEVLGYHLLPTPTATSYGSNQSESAGSAVRPSLNTLAPLLPTPRTVRGGSGSETVALLPTPKTTDNRAGSAADLNRHDPGLRALPLLLPTPTPEPSTSNGHAQEGHLGDLGRYGPAIRRWEHLTRPAPEPTKRSRTGSRVLNPQFAEWMQGLPAGWVTDTPGLTDNQALHAIGNGVVSQQAIPAIRECLAALLPHLDTA